MANLSPDDRDAKRTANNMQCYLSLITGQQCFNRCVRCTAISHHAQKQLWHVRCEVTFWVASSWVLIDYDISIRSLYQHKSCNLCSNDTNFSLVQSLHTLNILYVDVHIDPIVNIKLYRCRALSHIDHLSDTANALSAELSQIEKGVFGWY